jgi:hypothetical protein
MSNRWFASLGAAIVLSAIISVQFIQQRKKAVHQAPQTSSARFTIEEQNPGFLKLNVWLITDITTSKQFLAVPNCGIIRLDNPTTPTTQTTIQWQPYFLYPTNLVLTNRTVLNVESP